MQLLGMDGMRYLGADPSRPATLVEEVLMVELAQRVAHEMERTTNG